MNLMLQHLEKNIVYYYYYFMFAWGNNLMCALMNSSLSMWRCLHMITNLMKCELRLDGQLIFMSFHVLVMNTCCKEE